MVETSKVVVFSDKGLLFKSQPISLNHPPAGRVPGRCECREQEA